MSQGEGAKARKQCGHKYERVQPSRKNAQSTLEFTYPFLTVDGVVVAFLQGVIHFMGTTPSCSTRLRTSFLLATSLPSTRSSSKVRRKKS